jgi:hypothetical protein
LAIVNLHFFRLASISKIWQLKFFFGEKIRFVLLQTVPHNAVGKETDHNVFILLKLEHNGQGPKYLRLKSWKEKMFAGPALPQITTMFGKPQLLNHY